MTATFVELASSLVQDSDAIDLLDQLVNTCVDVLDVAAAGMLVEDASGVLNVAAASSEDVRTLEIFQSQSHAGPCWECARSGEPVESADLRTDDRWPEFSRLAKQMGFVSMAAVPLRLRGQTLGVLGLFGSGVATITPEDAHLARAFADVAAVGLLNQRNEHRSAVLAEHLRGALDSRVIIEQSKGVLAERAGVSIEQAFQRLRRHARDNNLKLTQVAREVIEGRLDLRS